MHLACDSEGLDVCVQHAEGRVENDKSEGSADLWKASNHFTDILPYSRSSNGGLNANR